jgi:hypothetical protein
MTPLYGGHMDHRKEYTAWEVRQLLVEAGFRVERLRTCNVYANDWHGWRSRLLWWANLGWHVLTFQPRRARNLMLYSGSTIFVDAVKVDECDMAAVAKVRV